MCFDQGAQDGLSERAALVPSPEECEEAGANGELNSRTSSSHCKGPEAVNGLVRKKLVCTHSHTIRWTNCKMAACPLIPSP